VEITKLNLSDIAISLKFDLSTNVITVKFYIGEKVYMVKLSSIIYFSLSNPVEVNSPMWSDNECKIIDEESCRALLRNRNFGFDVYEIPAECFYMRSEGMIFLEIISRTAEEQIVAEVSTYSEDGKKTEGSGNF
jgi:hypothetical protein